jgi:hypothetical protein
MGIDLLYVDRGKSITALNVSPVVSKAGTREPIAYSSGNIEMGTEYYL